MKKSDKNTKEKILEAAKEEFMKYGLYGARMQAIADTAGINKALLHYYFRNKEKLFDTVFEGALSKYFEQMDVFSDESLPVKERIFKYVDNIIDFLEEYPLMSMFIIKEISENLEVFRQKVMAAKKSRNVRLIPVLVDAMEKGEIKKIDPVMFLINLQSLCSYPFIAAPLFKHAIKGHGRDWSEFSTDKLKVSVKKIVEHLLNQ
jgi:TetR/AcrR family transcriptional regulator